MSGSGKTTLSNGRRLMLSWFVIGFLVRVAFAVIITLLMRRDREAVTMYLLDFPTLLCLDLIGRFFSPGIANQLSGSHPYYVTLNIFGGFIWGMLLMLAALAFSSFRNRKVLARRG